MYNRTRDDNRQTGPAWSIWRWAGEASVFVLCLAGILAALVLAAALTVEPPV